MPRRAPVAGETATPTRPITIAELPPGLVATPPRAPFVTTPLPPSNNPGNSIVPEANAPRPRPRRARNQQQQTPTTNGEIQNQDVDNPQIGENTLESTVSEARGAEQRSFLENAQRDAEDARQLLGLRDISSLATWTLSSSKPGCALPQLRNPSPAHFWQSDGPQPHTLTLHFFKLVAVVKMRIYLDFELDESYTPTKMRFFAGMSESGLVEFGSWETQETINPETGETRSSVENVRGWIDIPLKGVGGEHVRSPDKTASLALFGDKNKDSVREPANVLKQESYLQRTREELDDSIDDIVKRGYGDGLNETEYIGGDVLKAMVVQVRICENHQNGKDTHVRGFQVFARDEVVGKELRRTIKKIPPPDANHNTADDGAADVEITGLQPADFMRDPEIR